jgi:MFS family permease
MQSTKSPKLMMFILFGSMFLFGILENIKGVSFPLIKNEFGVSYELQGIMISILSLSYTVFVIASGFMLGFYKIKQIEPNATWEVPDRKKRFFLHHPHRLPFGTLQENRLS